METIKVMNRFCEKMWWCEECWLNRAFRVCTKKVCIIERERRGRVKVYKREKEKEKMCDVCFVLKTSSIHYLDTRIVLENLLCFRYDGPSNRFLVQSVYDNHHGMEGCILWIRMKERDEKRKRQQEWEKKIESVLSEGSDCFTETKWENRKKFHLIIFSPPSNCGREGH